VRPTGSAIYLLFAGGPSPTTPQVLTQLNRRGASATFFAEEGALSRHGDFMRTVVAADGIGIAETPHDGGSPVGADVMLRTATRTRDDLAAAAGKTPTCVLAPYGATDPASRARLASAGFRPVLWDIDPQDWRRPGTTVIATDVIDNVKPGSIVLLHDGEGDPSQMLAALPTILDTLTARGYTFAALPDCS
jgi:peptidoglycan/xylan/chitin deacetylase (PgdA/CDA1 family)